mgnify:CR=1 FL=1
MAKTATAAALGDLLAKRGQRVLLLDLDPQASLTQGLGIDAHGASLAEVIGGAKRGPLTMQQIIKNVSERLDIAPADIALAGCELGMIERLGRENIIKTALRDLPGYDVVIIDCPPALGLLTVNGLIAAHGVIVPTLPAAADLRGVKLFMDTLNQLRSDGLNAALELIGVLFVQYDPRLNAHMLAQDELKAAGWPVIGFIPRSVKVQESSAALQPVTTYDPTSKPAQAYIELERKVIKWLKRN